MFACGLPLRYSTCIWFCIAAKSNQAHPPDYWYHLSQQEACFMLHLHTEISGSFGNSSIGHNIELLGSMGKIEKRKVLQLLPTLQYFFLVYEPRWIPTEGVGGAGRNVLTGLATTLAAGKGKFWASAKLPWIGGFPNSRVQTALISCHEIHCTKLRSFGGIIIFKSNKKFCEELIAYFPWYDTGRIENVSNNSSIVACVLVTAVTFLPSRCLATRGEIHKHTNTQRQQRDLISLHYF
jgi:hypothetical protein